MNSSLNLEEPILNSKVARKILRSLPKRFRPRVTTIKESKDIDLVRIDKLFGFIQTYEMTLPNSLRSEKSTFKAFENDKKEIEMPNDLTKDELAHMAKRI